MMTNKITNLYIHIPFCDHICSYCDFYKRIANKDLINKYINYLYKELELKKKYLKDINIIYIGGGTPSCIGIDNLKLLFDFIGNFINLNNLIEFSIECNPLDITDEFINLLMYYKVNRISLGVQSFNNKKLKILNRNHNKRTIISALKLLNKHNFININIDIMYGLPKDNFKLLKNDFKYLHKFKIKHVSCYSLILEPKTILYQKYLKGDFKLFDEDQESKLYYQIQKYLHKLNYNQYEISNFCLPGYECKYNLNTWSNNKYLGIGTSASYYIDDVRYTNIKNLNQYFQGIDNRELVYYEVSNETNYSKMYEEIMLGLRKTNGINTIDFNIKYDCDIFKQYPNIEYLINNQLLIFDNNNLFIPDHKLYISNAIINKILN